MSYPAEWWLAYVLLLPGGTYHLGMAPMQNASRRANFLGPVNHRLVPIITSMSPLSLVVRDNIFRFLALGAVPQNI